MRTLIIVTFLALIALPCAAWVEEMWVSDVVELLEAGVGEKVILLQVEQTGSVFHLTTDDILVLKEAGAGDDLLAGLIRTGMARETAETRPAGPERIEGVSFLPSEPLDASERTLSAPVQQVQPIVIQTQPNPAAYQPVQVPVPYPVRQVVHTGGIGYGYGYDRAYATGFVDGATTVRPRRRNCRDSRPYPTPLPSWNHGGGHHKVRYTHRTGSHLRGGRFHGYSNTLETMRWAAGHRTSGSWYRGGGFRSVGYGGGVRVGFGARPLR